MADTDFSSLNPLIAPDPAFQLMIVDPSQPAGPGQFFRITCDNFAKLLSLLVTDKTLRTAETTSVTGVSGQGMLYFDSGTHSASVSENGGTVDQIALVAKAQTLLAKTLTNPTVNSGTFNTPTLIVPVIASFASAHHDHSTSAMGGALSSTITPGSKRNANITYGADGRLTAATDGSVDTPVGLTDAPTIATDASQGSFFRVTLTANRTLGAPSNPTDGQIAIWELIQDGTGSHTLGLASGTDGFAFGSDIPSITLTPTANKRDYLTCVYNTVNRRWNVVGFVKGFLT